MEMEELKRIEVRAFGETDTITVDDVGLTDLTEIVIDLLGPDGAADFLAVEGTEGATT
jgi:hypothetical protein